MKAAVVSRVLQPHTLSMFTPANTADGVVSAGVTSSQIAFQPGLKLRVWLTVAANAPPEKTMVAKRKRARCLKRRNAFIGRYFCSRTDWFIWTEAESQQRANVP